MSITGDPDGYTLEVVARAILGGISPHRSWETATEETRARCLEAAREAIAAMRFLRLLEETAPHAPRRG